jgi:hypothetical protein
MNKSRRGKKCNIHGDDECMQESGGRARRKETTTAIDIGWRIILKRISE